MLTVNGLTSADLAVIIRDAITHSGEEVHKIADVCGVSRQAVYGWMDTGRIAKKHLPVLALLTKTPLDAFLTKGVSERLKETPGGYHFDITIPLLEGFGDGKGKAAVVSEDVVMSLVVSPQWIRRHLPESSSPAQLRLIIGSGDSMKGLFNDGDTLIVDTGVTEIKVDAVYAMRHKGELLVKRMQRLPDGGTLMISENKSYAPLDISKKKLQEFQVVARVLKVVELKSA